MLFYSTVGLFVFAFPRWCQLLQHHAPLLWVHENSIYFANNTVFNQGAGAASILGFKHKKFIIKHATKTEERSPAKCHAAMSWAQRLKRVFNVDIEVCSRCVGAVRVIACIEDQDIIDRILAHRRRKEQGTPTRPLLVPPTRAPPATLSLFAGKESSSTAFHQ